MFLTLCFFLVFVWTQDPQIDALLAYIVTSPENTYPRGKHGEIKVHRSNACGYFNTTIIVFFLPGNGHNHLADYNIMPRRHELIIMPCNLLLKAYFIVLSISLNKERLTSCCTRRLLITGYATIKEIL